MHLNIEQNYQDLLVDIMMFGDNKGDRTGVGTKSLFGKILKHDMRTGFPLLTGKHVSFNAARTELLWILQGRTDLKYLEDNGVKYWRDDYVRSGRTDETLGPVYGKQWRDFKGVDQLKNVIEALQSNPESRRLMVSAWNPADMKDMALPPCHHGFQLNVANGRLDLLWNQRSADMFLGLPYDIAIYGLLLEIIAYEAGLIPGELTAMLGDCHIYNNHKQEVSEYINKPIFDLPKLEIKQGITIIEDKLLLPEKDDLKIINYKHGSRIKAPLNVG